MQNLFRHITTLKFTVLLALGLQLAFAGQLAAAETPAIRSEIIQPLPRQPIIAETSQHIRRQETLAAPQLKSAAPKIASLSFPWNFPVSAAVFKREKNLWIVFDHQQVVDLEQLRQSAGNLAADILQFPHPTATIIRLTPQEGVQAFVRKEGLMWIIDLTTGAEPPTIKDITVYTQYDSLKHAYLFIPTETSGNIVTAIDPDIGDIITIAPLATTNLGFANSYYYPEFDMLKTDQGLAFVIKSQDVSLTRGNTGLFLRAADRGLNISSDLDAKKRRQAFKDIGELQNTFDIKVSPQLLDMPYLQALDQMRQDILAAEPEKKNLARLELIKYFIAKGLGTNALYILHQMQDAQLPESKLDKFHALLGVANVLTYRYAEAVENFGYGNLPDNDEAVFWRTLASSALQYNPENNAVLLSYISLIHEYPQEIKDEIAVIATQNALAANDDMATQNFLDILKTGTNRLRNRDLQIRYLSAKKLELLGYPRNAIKEYRQMINSDSPKYSALSRYDNVVLSEKVNAIKLNDAIAELEKLKFAWSEKNFKWILLNKLADFYVKNNDYYNAVRTLKDNLLLSTPAQKEQLTTKMVNLFEDIYLNNQADDKMSAIKSLALYKDFEWLAALSKKQNSIIQKLADRLVAVDLMARAQSLLENLLNKPDLSIIDRAKVGARLGVIYLFQNKPSEALQVIDDTDSYGLPQSLQAHRRVIKARALADTGQTDDALELLEDDYSKNALLLKTEIYWRSEQWGAAADSIKYLIEKPTKGQPLSDEQIAYILDWATALKKSGRETVLVRLRHKFRPYFENTGYYSAFNVLTEHLENDKVDIRQINNIVNDVKAFSNFAKTYNESLQKTEIK